MTSEGSAAASGSLRTSRSYAQILKSSALIGGSSILTLAVSIVRAKTTAVLLGPGGVGAMGLYNAILELSQSLAGMGLNSSGVRQIAEANASDNRARIGRTAAVLWRTSLVLGLAGGLLLAALSGPVSFWTFGHSGASWPIVLLSLGVVLRSMSDGQAAAIQGMRRIAELARMSIIAAVAGTAATIALVWGLGEHGIVPSLVATAAVTLLVSWYFRRRIDLPVASSLTLREVRDEAWPLVRLGLAFMTSAVLMSGAGYVIRILVRDNAGVVAAGLYQSAWTIGGIYVAFILQAMGSDFYPRLTGVADDHPACNRLVNEQAQIGLLLAGPGVIGTLAFAPLVVAVLYHATFDGAVQPLRWICVGMALRVIAWPMGYIILAKGAHRTFFLTEVAAAVVHVALAFSLVRPFGVEGAAMAFAGLYVWHGALVYVMVRRLTDFRWSVDNRRLGVIVVGLGAAAFCASAWLPQALAMTLGAAMAGGLGLYSLRRLLQLVAYRLDGGPLSRLAAWLQITR